MALDDLAAGLAEFANREPLVSPGEAYARIKLPTCRSVVEGPRVRRRWQREVIVKLLETVIHLRSRAPDGARVLTFISWPELWSSGVYVFAGDVQWLAFCDGFNQRGPWYQAMPLPQSCDVRGRWRLPAHAAAVPVAGWRERIYNPADEDDPERDHHRLDPKRRVLSYEGQMWLFGDLPGGSHGWAAAAVLRAMPPSPRPSAP